MELVHPRWPGFLRHHQEPEVPDGNRLLGPQAQQRRAAEPDQGHDRPGAVDRPRFLEASGTAPVRDVRGLQTIGPALSTGPDFWKRPELRLYVTYADFNKAAAQDAQNGLPANKTNAVSYGAQLEIWF
ncbi:MAG: carbohydrate porin [Burkholderiales bacterium]|nr:carbohydrate porin [Burkholderiales bacterium]